MATGFTYTTYQSAVVTQIPSLTDDPNFQTMLPDAIDYAELSIYRDLDFLALHGVLPLGSTVIGNPTFVPTATPTIVVLEELFYGTNNTPISPASQAYIRAVYAGAAHGPPQYFAVIGGAALSLFGSQWTAGVNVLLGPTPDASYALNGYVTAREPPLSETNSATFISQNLPDLFWAASMIFWAGYNRNFGAQADDPRQAVSWSAEYQRLLHGADREEIRKKFLAEQATAKIPQARLGAQPAPQGAPA